MASKKRKIWDIVLVSLAVLLFLLLVKAIFGYLVNKSFVDHFKDGTYNKAFEDILVGSTLFERYVPIYNRANQYYQEGDYESAISYYAAALSYNIPEGKECDIRVNYALALINLLDPETYADEANAANSWQIILTAEAVLVEDECAKFRPDTGHDETAQKLLDEIEKLKENLPPPPPSNETSNNTQNNNGGGSSNDTNQNNSSQNSTQNNTQEDPYNGLENEIRGIQQNTIDQRQRSIDEDEYIYGNGTAGQRYNKRNW